MLIAKKVGIYFIDTEPASFSRYANLSGSMESISDLVESKDVKKFLREFQKQTEKSTREKQTKKHEKALKNPYMNLVSMYQEQEFTFSLSQVFEQQSC